MMTGNSFFHIPEVLTDRPPTTLTALRPPRFLKKSPPREVNADLFLKTQEKHKAKFDKLFLSR
jgi:hypothetical protein